MPSEARPVSCKQRETRKVAAAAAAGVLAAGHLAVDNTGPT